jgi:hypothetical protein
MSTGLCVQCGEQTSVNNSCCNAAVFKDGGFSIKMKCEDLADKLANGDRFDTYIQESFWERNFKTSACLEILVDEANERSIQLVDLDEWDFDKYFYNMYRCTEKGLS